MPVAVIDHRRHGAGLAGTGAADDQDQPPLEQAQPGQRRGQMQILEGGDPALDTAQHHAQLAALLKGTETESPQVTAADGDVALMGLEQLFPLP